jgi:hypothetical protein
MSGAARRYFAAPPAGRSTSPRTPPTSNMASRCAWRCRLACARLLVRQPGAVRQAADVLADWYPYARLQRSTARRFEALEDPGPRLARAAERQLAFAAVRRVWTWPPGTCGSRPTRRRCEPVPDGVAGAVVVFLHDFFDSPHVYADLVFEDFWQWICCTIDTLQAAGIRFYPEAAPEPGSPERRAVLEEPARRSYPHAGAAIAQGVSNAQLAQAGMACGVTVYGTVAHELAFLGIPSIACARHPHHAFDFCRTATRIARSMCAS